MPHFFNVFDRTATARSIHKPHHRDAQVIRHLLGKDHFVANGAIVRATTDRKVISNHNDGALV